MGDIHTFQITFYLNLIAYRLKVVVEASGFNLCSVWETAPAGNEFLQFTSSISMKWELLHHLHPAYLAVTVISSA